MGSSAMANEVEVSGLGKAATPAVLKEYFSHYGAVKSARLEARVDAASGKPGRIGIICFQAAKSAVACLAETEMHVIGDRVVDVAAPQADGAEEEEDDLVDAGDDAFLDDAELDDAEDVTVECEDEVPVKKRVAASTPSTRSVGQKSKLTVVTMPSAEAKKRVRTDLPPIAAATPVTASSPSSRANADKGRIHVSGLSRSKATQKSVSEYFSFYGKVKEVSLPLDTETGKSKGFAFVCFAKAAYASKAVAEKEPHVIDGRHVSVKPFRQQRRGGKLFVGGLSKKSTSASLKEYFSYYGVLLKADAKLSKESGQCRGFGFIEFEEPENAEVVLRETEPHIVDGKTVEVRKFLKVPPSDKIFVSGLPSKTTEASFSEYFSYYGDLTKARVKIDDEKRCRGFGFVQFVDPVSAELAINDTGHVMGGKEIVVRVFEKSPPVKLFIGGLGPMTTAASLAEYLSYYGDVKEVDVKIHPDTGRSRGFGFATFVDPVSTELVLGETAEHVVDGRPGVNIKKAALGATNAAAKVCIGGLPKTTTAASLAEYLSYYGELMEVDVKLDANTGVGRGFGFAVFVDPVSAELATTEAGDHVIDGKVVTIRRPGGKGKEKGNGKGKNSQTKVFVGGLAPTTTSETLWSYLAYYGELVDVDVKFDPAGRSRCFGFATFTDTESARLALAESNHVVDGKVVVIQTSQKKRTKEKKLFVGGLSPTTTAEALYEYLSYYGDLSEVDVKMDPETGNSRGFGFAVFADPVSTELVLAEAEHVVDGKAVSVREASERKQGGGA